MKYIWVIMDYYSRFTWTFLLRSKEEIFPVFKAFARQVLVKYKYKIVGLRSDNGTEFENIGFTQFCTELGISHNILSPRTPQQNYVVGRKIGPLWMLEGPC